MKKILLKTVAVTLTLIAGLFMATFAQSKKSSSTQKTAAHWIKVYRDVMMGDQSNAAYGPFLKTGTGEVVKIENADGHQKEIGFTFFTEYNGNYATLTFPGNATSAASYGTDDIGVFTEDPGGINHWDQANLNSGQITTAATSAKEMTMAEFNAIAESGDWTSFSTAFRHFNGGSGKLSFTSNFVHAEGNTVYMFQLNNTVRGFLYIKNLVPKSAKGGSVKFDMIIEGGDEYKSSDAKVLQPAKD